MVKAGNTEWNIWSQGKIIGHVRKSGNPESFFAYSIAKDIPILLSHNLGRHTSYSAARAEVIRAHQVKMTRSAYGSDVESKVVNGGKALIATISAALSRHNYLSNSDIQEAALVNAQCMIQEALNNRYGNPRDCDDEDPDKTRRLFKKQRRKLAQLLGKKPKYVKHIFSHNSQITVKELAKILAVLHYELILDYDDVKKIRT